MKKITLEIPDELDVDSNEASILLAAKLYEQGRLSLGEAASLAGYPKRDFTQLLGRYEVSLFNQDKDELTTDVNNARKYRS